jgi:membrane-bound lytic murein transglycosylase A
MVRRQNRQVVFFRIVGLNDDTEALGAQGIPLTAGRSIAVDKALHDYGTPFDLCRLSFMDRLPRSPHHLHDPPELLKTQKIE